MIRNWNVVEVADICWIAEDVVPWKTRDMLWLFILLVLFLDHLLVHLINLFGVHSVHLHRCKQLATLFAFGIQVLVDDLLSKVLLALA